MTFNGTSSVKIKSLNGSFNFREQRFLIEDKEVRYFDLSNQFREDYISDGLKELSGYYSNRVSYKEVEGVIESVTGERQLSDEKIQQIVVDKGVELSKGNEEDVNRLKQEGLKMPLIKEKVDIYARQEKEILIFDDGIQVQEQKANRDKRKDENQIEQPEEKQKNSL